MTEFRTPEDDVVKEVMYRLELHTFPSFDRRIVEQLLTRIETAEETLWRIKQWCEAYPLEVFPEPDFKKARELLEAGGMTLDAVSASNMRHVVTGIKKLIEDKNE